MHARGRAKQERINEANERDPYGTPNRNGCVVVVVEQAVSPIGLRANLDVVPMSSAACSERGAELLTCGVHALPP